MAAGALIAVALIAVAGGGNAWAAGSTTAGVAGVLALLLGGAVPAAGWGTTWQGECPTLDSLERNACSPGDVEVMQTLFVSSRKHTGTIKVLLPCNKGGNQDYPVSQHARFMHASASTHNFQLACRPKGVCALLTCSSCLVRRAFSPWFHCTRLSHSVFRMPWCACLGRGWNTLKRWNCRTSLPSCGQTDSKGWSSVAVSKDRSGYFAESLKHMMIHTSSQGWLHSAYHEQSRSPGSNLNIKRHFRDICAVTAQALKLASSAVRNLCYLPAPPCP